MRLRRAGNDNAADNYGRTDGYDCPDNDDGDTRL
jgi:hypothetical protein